MTQEEFSVSKIFNIVEDPSLIPSADAFSFMHNIANPHLRGRMLLNLLINSRTFKRATQTEEFAECAESSQNFPSSVYHYAKEKIQQSEGFKNELKLFEICLQDFPNSTIKDTQFFDCLIDIYLNLNRAKEPEAALTVTKNLMNDFVLMGGVADLNNRRIHIDQNLSSFAKHLQNKLITQKELKVFTNMKKVKNKKSDLKIL